MQPDKQECVRIFRKYDNNKRILLKQGVHQDGKCSVWMGRTTGADLVHSPILSPWAWEGVWNGQPSLKNGSRKLLDVTCC